MIKPDPATDPTTDVNHPSHSWNMDFTEAKEMMITGMRDFAETPEEVEVYAQVGAFLRTGLFDQLIDHQRTVFLARQKLQQEQNDEHS